MKIEEVRWEVPQGRREVPLKIFKNARIMPKKVDYSTRNRKANNFVVIPDLWKCLWKKLHDFENLKFEYIGPETFLHKKTSTKRS